MLLWFSKRASKSSRDAGLLLDFPELLGHDDAPGALAGVLVLVHLYFEVLLFRLLYLEDLLGLELPFHVVVSRDVDVQMLLLEVQDHRDRLNEVMAHNLVRLVLFALVFLTELLGQFYRWDLVFQFMLLGAVLFVGWRGHDVRLWLAVSRLLIYLLLVVVWNSFIFLFAISVHSVQIC